MIFSRQLTEDLTQKMGFWNDPIGLVRLPACSTISSIYLKMKDYRTDNKMHTHKNDNKMHMYTVYKWQKMAVASISTSSHYQVPQLVSVGLANYHLFVFRKWYCRQHSISNQFKLLESSEFTRFHFPVLQHFLCVLTTCVHHLSCISYKFNIIKVTPY